MSEWKETTLGEIADIIMGQSPTGETCNNNGQGLPLLNGPTEFGDRNPLPTQFTTDPKKIAEAGDLLFCVRGSTTGRMNWADQKYAIGRGIASIRAKDGILFQPYIRAIIEKELKSLLAVATGSTFPNISKDHLLNLIVQLPSNNIKIYISNLARILDEKIYNLRSQNETLEAIAQTLFKHWFIDFEFPNADGKPYKSSGGAMIPSELGDIPEGWHVGRLGNVAKNNSETHNFKGKNEIIFINTGDVLEGNFLHENYMPIDKLPGQAKKKIANNDILYSEIRPKNKRYAYVSFKHSTENYVVSTKFMVVRANDLILPRLLYLLLKRQESIDEFNYIAESRSGTFPQITFEAVSYFKFPLPPLKVQKDLMPLLTNLLEKKEFNISQIQTLTKTRDALLPKLMSGQLRVKE